MQIIHDSGRLDLACTLFTPPTRRLSMLVEKPRHFQGQRASRLGARRGVVWDKSWPIHSTGFNCFLLTAEVEELCSTADTGTETRSSCLNNLTSQDRASALCDVTQLMGRFSRPQLCPLTSRCRRAGIAEVMRHHPSHFPREERVCF
jgi:hypothetical protein